MIDKVDFYICGDVLADNSNLYVGQEGLWLRREEGYGRALEYFLENQEKTVTIEEVKVATGWKNPRRHMKRLWEAVNTHSSVFRIDTFGRGFNRSYTIRVVE